MKGLTDVPGILVGHVTDTDALTGCTVILCGTECRGRRGCARLGDGLLWNSIRCNPGHVAPNVHAIVLAGGSAFGLEATCGVRNVLEKRGVGFDTGVARVPIVPGRDSVRPRYRQARCAADA